MVLFHCPNQPYGAEDDWVNQGCKHVGLDSNNIPQPIPNKTYGDSEGNVVNAPHMSGWWVACTIWKVWTASGSVYGQSQSNTVQL